MRFPTLLAPVLFALLACAMPARAQQADTHDFGPSVAPEELDTLRGGYALPGGLAVGFGLERTVAVNGDTVIAQRIDIPDVATMTPDQARQLADFTRGRTFEVGGATSVSAGIGTLVIQNALDGQSIQVSTSLHTTVNTLGLLQNLNFSQSLSDAMRLGGSP